MIKRYKRKFTEKDWFKKPESEVMDSDFAIILSDGTRLFRMDSKDEAQSSINKLAQNLTKEQFDSAMKKLQMKYPGLSPEEKNKKEENIKRYKPIFTEKRMQIYKAWCNPSSDYFLQFSINNIHDEMARKELHKEDEVDALKHGYYRIFCGHELDIDSYNLPTDREFHAVKNAIDENTYKKFDGTRWSIINKQGFYYFPKQSFLFADSFKDAIHKSR